MPIARRTWIQSAAISAATLAVGAAAISGTARHQPAAFPSQPVKLVVPYPAGGIVDINARILADELAQQWRQPVIVDNRPGGNGNIGAEAVRGAKANGHTLLVGSTFLVMNPIIDKATRYRTQDFEPVVQLGSAPSVITVPASLPVHTLNEFIAYAKARPQQLNAASPGVGTPNGLALERLASANGLRLETVLYQGQPPYLLDLAQNRVQVASVTTTLALPYIKSGQLRPLAAVGDRRLAALPDVPSLAELGQREATVDGFGGLFAPAGTPPDVAASIQAAVAKVFNSPSAQARFAAQQIVLPTQPERFGDLVSAEQRRWTRHFAAVAVSASR